MRFSLRVTLLAVLSGGVVLPGCRKGSEPEAPGEVLVLIAASTSEAMAEAARVFEEETGVVVKISSGASNSLANQIISGVNANIFLSASEQWALEVQKAGWAVDVRPLLSNELVVVVPVGNPAAVSEPRDLLCDRVDKVALAGEKVPAGIYAEQALKKMELYDRLLENNLVARGQDVRLTLGHVETGEAQAGIVYSTDARASDRVSVVFRFPPDSHDPIVYPLVLLKADKGAEAAKRFYEFLGSEKAMALFEKHGFTRAKSPAAGHP